jgi:hypothetical protein
MIQFNLSLENTLINKDNLLIRINSSQNYSVKCFYVYNICSFQPNQIKNPQKFVFYLLFSMHVEFLQCVFDFLRNLSSISPTRSQFMYNAAHMHNK